MLTEKFGIINTLLQSQNVDSKIPVNSENDEFIDELMKIDFIQRKESATDVIITKCKIKRLVILKAIVDPNINFLIMSEDISKRSKLEIDTKEKHNFRNIVTILTESLGIVKNIPVNFTSRYTIYVNFAVVKYSKPMLILPNTLLNKYNYDLLASKRQLRLECNGKEFFIPINIYKVKNKLEVNCVNITSEYDNFTISNKIFQNLQNLSEDDNILKKKYINYENMKIHKKKLEKALFSSIQSNLKIIGYYNNLHSQIE